MTIGVLFFLSVLMTSCVTGGDDSPSEKEIQTSESHEFVAIMDMPYSAYQEKILKEQIIPAIDHRFSFVMHLGDFKSGDIDCTIEGMQDSLAMIYGIKPGKSYIRQVTTIGRIATVNATKSLYQN